MDASEMHLWDVSPSVSETSQKGLICKSLRRLMESIRCSLEISLWMGERGVKSVQESKSNSNFKNRKYHWSRRKKTLDIVAKNIPKMVTRDPKDCLLFRNYKFICSEITPL